MTLKEYNAYLKEKAKEGWLRVIITILLVIALLVFGLIFIDFICATVEHRPPDCEVVSGVEILIDLVYVIFWFIYPLGYFDNHKSVNVMKHKWNEYWDILDKAEV